MAPYNAAAFERVARRFANGPRSSAFLAIVSTALAMVMFFGASALFATAAKSLYLEAYGIEAQGRILDVSFHTSFANHKYVKWKKLDYEFTASAGEAVRGQLDRPFYELTKLPEGDHFTVLYWDRFPTINVPRGVKSNFGVIALAGAILLFGSVHFGCLSRRMIRWRKSLLAALARGHEGRAA